MSEFSMPDLPCAPADITYVWVAGECSCTPNVRIWFTDASGPREMQLAEFNDLFEAREFCTKLRITVDTARRLVGKPRTSS